MPSPLSCFLYTSRLTPDSPLTSIAAIVKQARELNAIHGITGVLMFDGENFAQYVEGPSLAISALAVKLKSDPRHAEFLMSARLDSLGERTFRTWSMGFLEVEIQDVDLNVLRQLSGDRALEYFALSVQAVEVL